MNTNPARRKPSVQVNEHSGFAMELRAYLNEARKGMTGRDFAKRAAAGTHDHWAKILAGTKVMTTNDIKVAAEVLGKDPYTFVEEAKKFARANVIPFPNVSGSTDDDFQQNPADEQPEPDRSKVAAKKGKLKSDQ